MGLIERYDDSRNKINPYDGGSVKYVSLSDDGVEFIQSNLLNRAFLFTKALDKLLGGYIEISLEILKDPDYGIEKITKWDFMFFVSAIDVPYSFKLSTALLVFITESFIFMNAFFMVDRKITKMSEDYWQLPLKEVVIYNLADTYFVNLASQNAFFVNQGLTSALQAGVGICMPIFMILSAISNLFGVGASSVMSRSLGKGNIDRTKNMLTTQMTARPKPPSGHTQNVDKSNFYYQWASQLNC